MADSIPQENKNFVQPINQTNIQPPASPVNPASIPAPSFQSLGQKPSQDPISSTNITQKQEKDISWRAWTKLAYIVIFIATALILGLYLSKNVLAKQVTGTSGEVLYQARYQPVLWKDFGEVFEPIVKIPVYYPSDGFMEKEFLLDSGALVSSLPREESKKMGISLAKLPRSTFGGFGNTTSFAYRAEVKIKLGEQEIKIPLVFTEAAGTKPILGRSGFFEKYSIHFNSKASMIEIRE
ncbi:hypothetical protein COT75_04240 [Candidatus Beckwithbacteria bacterium CG10_big_fil_rev_8_21_14_0_10_34_10]|uniref:Peptidase A2 domain-containing protein n=1 Tax=Candidatus Beckwithbacteria bacterium CG10_big_fil_rev_8_21_14_0_10_34_10 TaxID=1974495 RepID=A0A2H0W8D8_9BACT|nr:MAG: hypothetical protein COT75_04240 [Candidatus Beckwithbacteria bacterium CG10_big_fil_rev_8_21_14_0_10_34_10]